MLFNLSLSASNLFAIWKSANIIPILKPCKPPNLSTSYRPIFLLSPVVKIMERMLLPLICAGLTISRTQHGFAAGRSTTTALLPLVTWVTSRFNEKKPPSRTAAAILDISKAF
jgi:hypothetical protein